MASWARLEREAPKIARLGCRLLEQYGKAYLGTVSRSGAPRVHPVCPVVKSGRLLMGIDIHSQKFANLMSDRRVVLHALPGPSDAEFWVEGMAVVVAESDALALKSEHASLRVTADTRLFEIDICKAFGTIYSVGEGGHPIPDRRAWRCPEAVRS